MSRAFSTGDTKRLHANLLKAIDDRDRAVQQMQSAYASSTATEQSQFNATLDELEKHRQQESLSVQQDYDATVAQAQSQYDADYGPIQTQYQSLLREIDSRYESESKAVRQEQEDRRWMVDSVLDDSAGDSPKQKYETFKATFAKTTSILKADWESIDDTFQRTIELLRHRRQWDEWPAPELIELPTASVDLYQRFEQAIIEAKRLAEQLRRQKLSCLFSGCRPAMLFLVLTAALAITGFFSVQPTDFGLGFDQVSPEWLAILGGGGVGFASIFLGMAYAIAKSRSANSFLALQQQISLLKRASNAWSKSSKAELERRKKESQLWQRRTINQRENALYKADADFDHKTAALESRHKSDLQEANDKFPELLQKTTERRNQLIQQGELHYNQRNAALDAGYQAKLAGLKSEHAKRMAQHHQPQARKWDRLALNWHAALAEIANTCLSLNEQCQQRFPNWTELSAPDWSLPDNVPAAIRVGQFDLDLGEIKNAIPSDSRLVPEETRFTIPLMLPFPENPSLLLKAAGDGRTNAVKVIQTAMLRLLTSLPAGKVRFTVIDPVGLGENFSAFMHLVDYDELLISNRIWTETAHIEKRLADLTEHMENVFQKYLRNEFQSIQEYNDHAGEVAEAYHVLVIADFPVNFSENAAKRLVSIATSGARCGVFTLVSVDTKQRIPQTFEVADLESNATTLAWKGNRFVTDDENLQNLPLSLDEPPGPDQFSRIVRSAGNQSKDSRRVEVSFARIAPKDDQLWNRDSRSGIEIPLGRAGATKLQYMRLGQGTSQHVMVAGKTGSGKSSFMHTLITNVALHYSWNEVEFYLIDFKKGVEFKTYATHALPHARVIAIESDREFGVSVLERLDSVLKERGDLFRQSGVPNIASYRDAVPDQRMPRIMLLVDEFQEFFVEDDKHSQTASLLLDRLVRQGRAFGIHVLLGSQTLGGAYSLARSTLGQVAVRIALQCSEADAHLILSEENTAARLLTRPGEAIYNDANGLLEGNHPFQIAWLPDAQRERSLKRIEQLVREHHVRPPGTIVFEGNIPADPSRNQSLVRLLNAGAWNDLGVDASVWLGEAVAIKEPTHVVFRRQSGGNLLVVGQSPPSALGILSSCLVSLCVQTRPRMPGDTAGMADFYILDGSFPEEFEPNVWQELSAVVPHQIKLGGVG